MLKTNVLSLVLRTAKLHTVLLVLDGTATAPSNPILHVRWHCMLQWNLCLLCQSWSCLRGLQGRKWWSAQAAMDLAGLQTVCWKAGGMPSPPLYPASFGRQCCRQWTWQAAYAHGPVTRHHPLSHSCGTTSQHSTDICAPQCSRSSRMGQAWSWRCMLHQKAGVACAHRWLGPGQNPWLLRCQ